MPAWVRLPGGASLPRLAAVGAGGAAVGLGLYLALPAVASATFLAGPAGGACLLVAAWGCVAGAALLGGALLCYILLRLGRALRAAWRPVPVPVPKATAGAGAAAAPWGGAAGAGTRGRSPAGRVAASEAASEDLPAEDLASGDLESEGSDAGRGASAAAGSVASSAASATRSGARAAELAQNLMRLHATLEAKEEELAGAQRLAAARVRALQEEVLAQQELVRRGQEALRAAEAAHQDTRGQLYQLKQAQAALRLHQAEQERLQAGRQGALDRGREALARQQQLLLQADEHKKSLEAEYRRQGETLSEALQARKLGEKRVAQLLLEAERLQEQVAQLEADNAQLARLLAQGSPLRQQATAQAAEDWLAGAPANEDAAPVPAAADTGDATVLEAITPPMAAAPFARPRPRGRASP